MAAFFVGSGQTLSGVILGSGDTEDVWPGGTAIGTIINGGYQDNTGTATGTIINGGAQDVYYGTASNTTIYGGHQLLEFGATASNTTIYGGAQVAASGTTATSTTIYGGTQDVAYSGTASDTTIYGGVQHVESGGIATSTTISGGYQDDFGTAIGTIINSSGVEIVERGGTASSTVVNGGIQLVESGGTGTGTTVYGGVQVVELGGSASNTTVYGGVQLVEGDRSTASNTTINGGTERVSAGGTANGVIFAGPAGVLQLEQPGSLIGTISGWQIGDVIDFSTNVTGAAISGSTLEVTVSGQSFSYQLAGQQAGTIVQIDQGHELQLVLKPPPAVTEALANDTGKSSTDRITSDPALTGAGDPNAIVSFTIDGTPIDTTATADAAGAWSYTPSGLADGSHTIVASETDAVGNTGIASLTFTLDTDKDVMPSFTVAGGAPIIGIVNLKAVSFAVGGLDDETGTATFSDGNSSIVVPVCGNGTFTADLSALTPHQITSFLSVGDIAGNAFFKTGNAITIDPGPTAGAASIMVAAGASTDLTAYLLGLDKPGIAGDSLALSGDSTAGTKGTVTLANGRLAYAAPASPGSDGFGYTVTDQYGDAASASVTISAVTIGNIGSSGGTVVLGNNSTSVGFGQGTVTVVAGNGSDTIAGGTANDTVIAGNGNDAVTLGQGNNIVILGSGNDSVTLSDGNNTVTIAGSATATTR
jgi:autotransporter passenger strand-loop-strand repeat protein